MNPATAALLGFLLGATFASAVAALLWWRYSRPAPMPYQLDEYAWVAYVRDQARGRWNRGEHDAVMALRAELRLVTQEKRRA